jgi:tellurite resistance protein TerC
MTWFWTGFILLVLCLLALDLGVLNKRAHAPSIKEALGWTAGWVSLGVLFSGVVYYIYQNKLYTAGGDAGTIPYSGVNAMLTYLTGFVLEESLSIDNLFVMVLIFRNYRIPGTFQHRVLFWGILGAIVMRAGMILGGVWLVTRFGWVMYLFGAYLIIQGVSQLKPEKEDNEVPSTSMLERLISKILPITREENPSGHFLLRLNGKLYATTLLVALVSVEAADVVFALDSVPAVLTVTTDPFIVFTSNVFAILGLRSLYFVIAGMMDRFGHLKYALAAILVFVGAKMVLHKLIHIPIWVSLGVIVLSVVVGVLSSMWASRTPVTGPS